MKSLLPAALILVLVLPFWGGYLGLRHQQKAIRREVKQAMERGLSDSELVFFSFSTEEASALEWEHDREFRYRDNMYDVVRKDTCEGRLEVWCWLDDEESALKRRFDRLVRAALGGDADPHGPLADWGAWMKRLFTTTETHFAVSVPSTPHADWPFLRDERRSDFSLAPSVPPPNA